ncbi:phage tail fiber protein [Sphingobium sp. WCS2017Hpa-17]|uniref:phage tail fiber protein n=1 Tax=Sphingobium sp. WCS2017Hpa-17 TaxID=3073638 RepID=UPI00288A9BDD|nr:hypothetical protein [Sphingobium sp. WCS2017Hpa-17]
MNTRTLTSANSIIMLSVAGLYASPQRIQGYSADDISGSDAISPKQTSMGLDGRLSAGFVPQAVVQNITLQADSLSNDLFENWAEAEKVVREAYEASGLLIIPATQRKYTLTRGFLTSYPAMPSLRNTVQPQRYAITWERVSPSPWLS